MMETITVKIDGNEIKTSREKTVIAAAIEAGIAIPHYCYHPRLSIAGNCRMCLVEIEKMPKLQIACNTRIADGMEIRTESPKVAMARRAVMEFLLINHPLDCPICDQAGECRLQEYYMEFDLQSSRFQERKEHDCKREIFGPYVVFDGERCIKCTRCVRFCQEITKTEELTMVGRGDHETVTLFPGMVLDNPLSANVIDLCPVGALTDRDFRFQKRVWYLQKTSSVCPGCSTGCNITIGHSQNRIFRFKPRVNEEVNSHWLCDEGRYCFHGLTAGDRVSGAFVRRQGQTISVPWDQAIATVLHEMKQTAPAAGILSARSTNEEAFLFAKLAKGLFGVEHVEVGYEERALSPVEKLLKSPDRAPNFQGARQMGVVSENGGENGYRALLDRLKAGTFQALYIVGEDIVRDHPETREALSKIPFLLVQDSVWSETARLAHVVFGGTNFAEKDGTYTNRSFRLQRVLPALLPPRGARQDWMIFRDLLLAAGEKSQPNSASEIFERIAAEVPMYEGITHSTIGELGISLQRV